METLGRPAPEPRLAVVVLPQADLLELLRELAGCSCRAVTLVGGGPAAQRSTASMRRRARGGAPHMGCG